jgi:peptidoglycan/xylan/chitin deacetylase (PgdA/CDA1 family)
VKIIMYHYVRNEDSGLARGLNSLSVENFNAQLALIAEKYWVISVNEILESLKAEKPLPDDAVWLTFDDGYIEHFATVAPLLIERGWQGSFFPVVQAAEHRVLMDVNKIQFIIGQQPDYSLIIQEINNILDSANDSDFEYSFGFYWNKLGRPQGVYSAEEIFVKRMLQKYIPRELKKTVIQNLFHRFVPFDEEEIVGQWYMNKTQLADLVEQGMYVGSHGVSHQWMDNLSTSELDEEICGALSFLNDLGAPVKDWVMCYPYGASTSLLQTKIRVRGCALALGTTPGAASIKSTNRFDLPRIDTINFL